MRPIVAAFLKYLTGPEAATSFRQRGMLLVNETWRPVPGPRENPPPDPEPAPDPDPPPDTEPQPAAEEPAPTQT